MRTLPGRGPRLRGALQSQRGLCLNRSTEHHDETHPTPRVQDSRPEPGPQRPQPACSGTHGNDDDDGYRAGRVFTSTNAVAGNELLGYAAPRDGALTLQARLATQGQGTGTGLGNQGAVTLSGNGRFLFVVNALSNSVSTFAVRRGGVELRSTVDSGGLRWPAADQRDRT